MSAPAWWSSAPPWWSSVPSAPDWWSSVLLWRCSTPPWFSAPPWFPASPFLPWCPDLPALPQSPVSPLPRGPGPLSLPPLHRPPVLFRDRSFWKPLHGGAVTNPVRGFLSDSHQRSPFHHIDSHTTIALHIGLHFPSSIALITPTAVTNQTHFISHGLPLSHGRVLFAHITLLAKRGKQCYLILVCVSWINPLPCCFGLCLHLAWTCYWITPLVKHSGYHLLIKDPCLP